MDYCSFFEFSAKTPLHYACVHTNSHCSKLLIDSGAQVDFLDCDGNSALHICSKNGQLDIVIIFKSMIKNY